MQNVTSAVERNKKFADMMKKGLRPPGVPPGMPAFGPGFPGMGPMGNPGMPGTDYVVNILCSKYIILCSKYKYIT
jgi:hypothetical protein